MLEKENRLTLAGLGPDSSISKAKEVMILLIFPAIWCFVLRFISPSVIAPHTLCSGTGVVAYGAQLMNDNAICNSSYKHSLPFQNTKQQGKGHE